MLTGLGLTGILAIGSVASVASLTQSQIVNHQMHLAVLNQESMNEIKHNLNNLPVMKLLNFRSTQQIKQQLPKLIVEAWNSDNVEGDAWSVDDLPNFKDDLTLLDPKFDGQSAFFVVDSKPESTKVSGSVIFEFRNQMIDLSTLNQDGHLAISEDDAGQAKNLKTEILRKVNSQLVRQGFMSDPIFSDESNFNQINLKFSHETYYPLKKDGYRYLKSFDVELTSKIYDDFGHRFSAIKFGSVQAPIYATDDIFLNPDTDAFGAYADSETAEAFNSIYQKAMFNVSRDNSFAYAHTTNPKNWAMNDAYLITTIDYQALFNYATVEEFFSHYNLSYEYTYKMNALGRKGWVNEKGLNAKTGHYGNILGLNTLKQERVPYIGADAKTAQFQNIIGNVRLGATAGASVYAVNQPDRHKIYIYAQTGVWIPKNTHNHHLAAFAAIIDTNVSIIPHA